MKKLCFLFFAATVVLSCNQPAGTKDSTGSFNLDSAKASIQAVNASFIESVKNGDSAAFLNCYTKNACMMPAGSPKLCTTASMMQFFNGARKMGIASMNLQTLEVSGSKDLVVEEGIYEMFTQDGKSVDKGKYLTTWKQEDGKWKLYRDMFSSDMPPPPAEPAKK